ncbi:hypothetical protein RND81_11G148000 [Saponaria officinalis]|uniref:Uncharacterized protein n=1 Tax=Saponaria officinalis TaxID=3572 RepID=A0AAW1HMR0_SAPOF
MSHDSTRSRNSNSNSKRTFNSNSSNNTNTNNNNGRSFNKKKKKLDTNHQTLGAAWGSNSISSSRSSFRSSPFSDFGSSEKSPKSYKARHRKEISKTKRAVHKHKGREVNIQVWSRH